MAENIQFKRDKTTPEVVVYATGIPVDRLVLKLAVQTTIQSRLDVSPEQIGSVARGAHRIVFARHLSLYLAQALSGATLTELGALFGTTRQVASFAMRRIEDCRDDVAWDRTIDLLVAEAGRLYRGGRVRIACGVSANLTAAACTIGEVRHA